MSRAELKMKAKNQLGNHIFGEKWLIAAVVSLVAFLLGGQLLSSGVKITQQFLTQDGSGILNISLGGASAGVSFVTMIVSGPLTYAVQKMFLKQARDNEVMKFEDLLCGFKEDFANLFLIDFISGLKAMLWGLLFIIPGIIKAFAYSMAFYIKADNPGYDWRACLAESEKMMKGHKGELFVLELSFIGWQIVGALCLGVGIYWAVAYSEAAKAHFYESIKGENKPQEKFVFGE